MAWKQETLALHAGQTPDPYTGSCAVPIYQSSAYVFKDTAEARELFQLKPSVWASRLNPDKADLLPQDFQPEEQGYIYTRLMNPTTDVLEKRLMYLEGGIGALAVSSGSEAIAYAVMNICQAGDHILSSSSLYGGTYNLFSKTFPRLGISCSFFNPSSPEKLEELITAKTRCIFVESIGNPGLDVPDLEQIARIAHASGLPLLVDNTLPSPYLCRPAQFGADIIIHSLTKFCNGHGNSMGGAIVDSGNFDWESSGRFPMLTTPDDSPGRTVWTEKFGSGAYILHARYKLLRDMGGCISPFNSFMILQGLETLPLRMQRHSENALQAARFLQQHPRVSWVLYPGLKEHPTHALAGKYLQNGFGALIGFGIKGGAKAGQKFIESLKLFSHVANIGDTRSLAIHPASTTHSQLSEKEQIKSGVTPDFIRLSIGIENIEDIVQDLDQGLDAAV